MDDQDITFPMDAIDPSRAWKFKPEGHLVVILTGDQRARRERCRRWWKAGFEDRDIKVYSGEQTLENDAVNMRRRAVASRLLGPVMAQTTGRDLYLGYARKGRSALWVRLPNEDGVSKALKVLADYDYLHARYYGFNKWEDFSRLVNRHPIEAETLDYLTSRSCAEPWTRTYLATKLAEEHLVPAGTVMGSSASASFPPFRASAGRPHIPPSRGNRCHPQAGVGPEVGLVPRCRTLRPWAILGEPSPERPLEDRSTPCGESPVWIDGPHAFGKSNPVPAFAQEGRVS